MRAALIIALLVLPGLVAAAPPPVSSPQPWAIDAAKSQAQFSVRKFLFVHVRGTFPDLSGTLRRIDTHIGADLVQVDATLDVGGLQMDDDADRTRALGPGFFDAERFSVVRFDSDPFPLDELVSGGTLHGLLTLHGERHPVKLALQASDCPRQPLACVIRVQGTISRSLFGMHAWRGVLSDRVELDLRIALRSSMDVVSPESDPEPGSSTF
ncbi:MAG TPA: YceI family protein [Rhodanobacteraceae bacterium]|nr:YceI family protein [Rhodanobacteraceae bacterium]